MSNGHQQLGLLLLDKTCARFCPTSVAFLIICNETNGTDSGPQHVTANKTAIQWFTSIFIILFLRNDSKSIKLWSNGNKQVSFCNFHAARRGVSKLQLNYDTVFQNLTCCAWHYCHFLFMPFALLLTLTSFHWRWIFQGTIIIMRWPEVRSVHFRVFGTESIKKPKKLWFFTWDGLLVLQVTCPWETMSSESLSAGFMIGLTASNTL